MPEWNEYCGCPSFAMSWRGSSNEPRTGCWAPNGFTGQSYANADDGSASATEPTAAARTRTTDSVSLTSRIDAGESPARDALLPAGRRRGRPATVEVRDASARARHRDARARALRSEV